MATTFGVQGPREVPVYQGKAGRTIIDDNIKDFWRDNVELASRRGCYIFGVRAGKGYTPGYVGRATKSFKQEVFAYHKLNAYQQFLVDYLKGTPVFFFIVSPMKKGAPNAAHIGELEDFLIQAAVAVNPDLQNVKGTKSAEWGIQGVLRGGKGKPGPGPKELKRLLKL